MRYLKGLLVTAGMALAAGSAMAAQPQEAQPQESEALAPAIQGKFFRAKTGRSVMGEYIVLLKDRPSRALHSVDRDGNEFARLHGVEIVRTYEHAFRGFLMRATEAQAQALAEHPRVESVEENAIAMVAGGVQSSPPWNLDRIDQPSRSLDNAYAYDDATDVHVYLVDTGITEYHGEFSPDGWTSRVDTVFSYFNDGNADGAPGVGHGTFVAGIVGGATFGVAKQVKLHSVKVMNNSGVMTTDSINAGLNWLVANAQTPAVVNMSVNANVSNALTAAAATLADKSGIVVVSAAGNALVTLPGGATEGVDACNVSPNNTTAKKIIVVGATDRNDVRMHPDNSYVAPAIYSNFGACVDIFAPGVDVRSATKDGLDGFGSGTSFAAPHVSGMAAILLSKGVSAANVKQQLINDSLTALVGNPGTGSPNRLLFKRPEATRLTNGVGQSISGAAASIKNFVIDVPAGRPSVTLNISGGTGDADIYVRFGAIPETYAYNCRPLRSGNNESCAFNNPAAGPWYIQVRGFQAYSTTVKGQY
ncbi:S8 family peptidase [Archangium violaceum]|uniref:S8 family peptidase n=1 Tax=Archangium violaceum TaxID=83451 RepID=UPI0036DB0DF8